MQPYKHTQFSAISVISLAIAFAVTVAVFVMVPEGRIVTGPVFTLFALALVLFYALTVEVSPDEVLLVFGIGLIWKSIEISSIRDARMVRNKWYYGWGIRLTPYGWLWNASGLDAVELEFDGGKTFRIGSDEPEALLSAIRNAVELEDDSTQSR